MLPENLGDRRTQPIKYTEAEDFRGKVCLTSGPFEVADWFVSARIRHSRRVDQTVDQTPLRADLVDDRAELRLITDIALKMATSPPRCSICLSMLSLRLVGSASSWDAIHASQVWRSGNGDLLTSATFALARCTISFARVSAMPPRPPVMR